MSGWHSFPGNTSIRATLYPEKVTCTCSDCALSREILRSAQRCVDRTSSVPARIALFPWKYIDLYHFASCDVYTHQVHMMCSRSDRTFPLGIRRSAQLCIAPSAQARIVLFPGKYFDPHHFASGVHQVHPLGSHSFPGNTSICTTVHQVHIK